MPNQIFNGQNFFMLNENQEPFYSSVSVGNGTLKSEHLYSTIDGKSSVYNPTNGTSYSTNDKQRFFASQHQMNIYDNRLKSHESYSIPLCMPIFEPEDDKDQQTSVEVSTKDVYEPYGKRFKKFFIAGLLLFYIIFLIFCALLIFEFISSYLIVSLTFVMIIVATIMLICGFVLINRKEKKSITEKIVLWIPILYYVGMLICFSFEINTDVMLLHLSKIFYIPMNKN
ncbi:hypothetical protein BDAP_002082 [Binucleata daphniae]